MKLMAAAQHWQRLPAGSVGISSAGSWPCCGMCSMWAAVAGVGVNKQASAAQLKEENQRK
jgi:hypothetical protein